MPLTPSHWTLLGGAPCLDFTNSKSRSPAEGPFELIGDYPALLQWGLQLGLLTQAEAEAQFALANRHANEAQAALERALALREALYAAFSALTAGQTVPAEALAAINAAWQAAADHLQLAPDGEKLTWQWAGLERALDGMLWPVARSAVELLASENIARVKRCGGCGWLFLDTTRDARRRWCDMKICGNRAKARRHYDRQHPSITS